MHSLPVPASARPLRWRRRTPALAIGIFLLLGLLQTLAALALFQRADDNDYFLSVANFGSSAVDETGVVLYDLKAKVAAKVFYAAASPARWFGGGEVAYLLWLRVLTLVSFLFAFEGLRRLLPKNQDDPSGKAARLRFMALCLLYPGQLAWTASLLRDGLSCTFLFTALLAWSKRRRLAALAALLLSLTLRPEFVVVITTMTVASAMVGHFRPRRHRVYLLLGACWLVSVALFEPRNSASQFAQFAFAEGGSAYPVVAHPFDLGGYVLVVLQSLVDPLSIAAPAAITAWGLAEAVFFCWLIFSGLKRLRAMDTRALGLYYGVFVSTWLFAYFEMYVSGFSRHRMAQVVLMLALSCLTRRPRSKRLRPCAAAAATSAVGSDT